MVIIIEICQKSFRYCKKMNPKNTDVKNYKRQKILKKQKDSKPTNYIYICVCVCVCVCVCDYTTEKYKRKICYPQKNNSWL